LVSGIARKEVEMELTEKQIAQGLSKGGIPRKEIMKRIRRARSNLVGVQDTLAPVVETYAIYDREAHMQLLINALEIVETAEGFLADLEKWG